jgi:hypothetical protein
VKEDYLTIPTKTNVFTNCVDESEEEEVMFPTTTTRRRVASNG